MAYVLIIVGLMLTISGARGTQDELFGLVKGDFTGGSSFVYWLAAIAIIGGVGYAPALRKLSHAFLALVLLVLLLSNKGVFEQFTQALKASATGGETVSPGLKQDTALFNPSLFGDYSKLPDYLMGNA